MAGRRLIAAGGSGSNELRLFDLETSDAIGRLLLPRGVYGLDFAYSGKLIAVAGGDSIVRVLAVPPHGGELRAEIDATAASPMTSAASPASIPSPPAAPVGGTPNRGDEAVELDAGTLELD